MDKLGGLLDATRSDLSALDTEAQPDAVIWLQGGAAVAGAGFAADRTFKPPLQTKPLRLKGSMVSRSLSPTALSR
jgi:hypothetical protein